MVAIPARVDELEEKVGQHHTVLFGPDGCPEEGLVKKQQATLKKLSDMELLLQKQTIYNEEMVEVAKIIRTAIILALIGAVLALVLG
jgi:hypothetical protein